MTTQNPVRNPSCFQSLSHCIIGIKLEPVIALSSARQVGAEVLSILAGDRQNESFFCDQTAEQSLMLLEAQLAALKNAVGCHNLFVNLPISVITVAETYQRLLALKCPPLNIEIVDPATVLTLSDPQRENVRRRLQRLRRHGHRIWLDDVDEALVRSFLSCRLPLDGVKIDKFAFWRLREKPALAALVAQCSQLAANVLIEGIETDRDQACALQAGARFGQGYRWPSWKWPED